MNRKLIFVVIAILICGIGAFLWSTKAPKNIDNQNNSTGLFPSNTSNSNTTSNKLLAIKTRSGNTFTVKDFTEGTAGQQVSETPGDIQFDLTPYPEYVPGQPYPSHAFDIVFNKLNSEFIVTINSEPLSSSRKQAGLYLKNLLEISDSQLCELNSVVTVGNELSEQFSATNLGFNNCVNAVQLP